MNIPATALEKGDIIIMHDKDSSADTQLVSHVSVVAQQREGLKPFIFDLSEFYGFARIVLPTGNPWSVYRVDKIGLGAEAALIGSCWLVNSSMLNIDTMRDIINSPNIYSNASIITSYLGSSVYGSKTAEYASYLGTQCMIYPPHELRQTASAFSGVICSYLPIALYQAALGMANSANYMAIDPRKSIPRDLAKYLNNNSHWKLVGTIDHDS